MGKKLLSVSICGLFFFLGMGIGFGQGCSGKPTASISGTKTICANTSTTLAITGGPSVGFVRYTANNGAPSEISLNSSGQATINLNNLTTTTTIILTHVRQSTCTNWTTLDNISATVTVNPVPTVTKPRDQTVCAAGTVTAINFSGSSVSGTTYQWTNNNTVIGLAASGTGNIPAFSTTHTTNASITANITVTPVANNCSGIPQTFSIRVNPTATVTKPADQSFCAGENVPAINFSGSSVSGTTYNWTNNNTAIGLGASGTGNISSFSASNNTNAPITANIIVTPVANNCDGTPQTFSITVNPTATVTKPSDQIICNGETVSPINFSGSNVSGTSYQWTNDNTTIGLAGSGTGNIASFTGTNNTNAPITANITVAPVANNCDGIPQTFSITVNPTAIVTKPSDQIVCNAGTVSAIEFTESNVTGTTYKWSNDNTTIGLAGSGTGNIASFTGTNNTNAPITANITVTPIANNCDGIPQTFNITVNPTATVTKPSDQTVCNGAAVSPINISGSNVSGTSYQWTNDNTTIGLAGSGTGNIASFTGTNNTNAPIIANITVTPVANNCDGIPQTFSITVNPTATFTKPSDQIVCNEGMVSAIEFTGSNVTGTTYKWSNDNTTIGLAGSGTGNIASFTGTNNTNAPITANITVTPVANNCDGTSQTFSITVNPSTTVDAGAPQAVCSGGTITLAGNITGGTTIGTWSATSGTFSNANALTSTYTPSITSGTVTLTLTSEDSDGAGPCTAVTDTVEITVFEKVEIVQEPADVTICSANRAEFTVEATGDGLTYQWFKRTQNGEDPVPGATTKTLFFASVAPSQQGIYFAKVNGTAPCTTETSGDVELIVNLNIVVNTHPLSDDICVGDDITLTVDASYEGAFPNYQWRFRSPGGSWTPLTGENSTSLNLENIQLSDLGDYDVEIYSTYEECETGYSSIATINVYNPPTVNTANNFSICSTASEIPFNAEADNYSSLEWTVISGSGSFTDATVLNATYVPGTAESGDVVLQLQANGYGTCGSVTDQITINIIPIPEITIHPQATVLTCESDDDPIILSVNATGPIAEYRWRKNGVPLSDGGNISGATTAELTISNQTPNDSDSYDVKVTSPEASCAQVISNPSVVTVNSRSADPVSASTDATENKICLGDSTILTLNGGGGGTEEEIRWYTDANGANQIGTGNNLPVSPEITTTYFGRYEDPTGCATPSAFASVDVVVNFDSTIELTSAPDSDDQTICINNSLTSIIYQIGGGGNNAVLTGDLPANVTGSFADGKFTISGTPSESGTFNYTVITEGPCDQESLSGTIIVNPATVVTIAAEHQSLEICFDGTAYNITAGAAAENYSSTLWTVPSGSGTIANENSLTEATFTPASGVSNVTLTLTAHGLTACSDATATKEISIQPLPTVTAITYGDGVTEFCDDESSPQPVITGTNEYTGGIFSFSPATGEPVSNILNLDTTSGLISAGSDPGKYDVTYSTPTGAICGVISNSVEVTVTKLPSTVFNYTKTDYCITDLNASVAEGIETGGTFSSETLGAALNANTGVIFWQLTSTNLIGSHTITYTIPPSGGCEPVTHSQSINIDPIPQGGVLSFGTFGRIFVICENPGNNYAVDLNLTGSVGRVVAWKYRTSTATTWTDLTIDGELFTGTTISANVLEGLIAAGGMESMVFRVQLGSSGCSSSVFSETGIVSVISSSIIEPSPVTVSDDVICIGDEITLSASANYIDRPAIADDGEFGNSSITNRGWRIDKDPKEMFNSAANNTRPDRWLRANPREYSTAEINAPYTVRENIRWSSDGQPGFALVSGNRTSTLETPVFDIDGIDQAILSFDQAYSLTPGASIGVEISTNGGNSYLPEALYERIGPLSSGNFGDFSTGTVITRPNNKILIDLGNYMGQGNLRIRFTFVGTRVGDIWGLDNIDIPEGPRQITTVWTDYTDPNKPVEIGRSNTQEWTPERIGLNTFEVQRFIIYNSNGDECENSTPPVEVDVFVFDNYSSTATTQAECGKYGVPIQAALSGTRQGAITTYPTPDGFNGRWQVEGPTGYVFNESHFRNPDGTASSSTNPNAVFNPNQFGSFTLSWTLLQEEGREIICTNTINPVTFEIQDIYTSTATAQVGLCGDSSIQLNGEVKGVLQGDITSYPTLDGYIATWTVTGPTGYTFSNEHFSNNDPTDPNAVFTPGKEGDFILRYSLTKEGVENTGCLTTYTDATFTIVNCTSLDFDGEDDYVDLGVNYTGTGYSFEAWVKPATPGGTIISGPQFNITAPTGLSTSRWTHIAVSGNILYLDGVASGTPPAGTVGARALIGARWNGTDATDHFHGWIEEVRIWNGSITPENIKFTMNQRLKGTGNIGEVVDMTHPDAPSFANLAGYYRLISAAVDPLVTHAPELLPTNGLTIDLATSSVPGILKNMTTNQQNTAPLPYFTGSAGAWDTSTTWARPTVWNIPNTNNINWNIVRLLHNVNSPRGVNVLGLLVSASGILNMEGVNPTSHALGGTGNALTISHYLKLDGFIDLNGESQLLQPESSIVDNASVGYLDRDQQGKKNAFIYNYWSSPVSTQGSQNNGGYSVGSILKDGTTSTPGNITWNASHAINDGGVTTPITISTYWLWGFSPAGANLYSEWDPIKQTGNLNSGEGFTMKGTDGTAALTNSQNYTFRGKPHNGDLTLSNLAPGENYLIGNPYSSALDAYKFIDDNDVLINGTIYFWDHFKIVDHILLHYVGGYATMTKLDAVPAASIDERINNDTDPSGNPFKSNTLPKRFIPVGQGFMINSTGAPATGNIKFKNSQREFIIESPVSSIFLKPEIANKKEEKSSEFKKIRLSFSSPMKYRRQILVGAVPTATDGFDLGYDAHLFDDNVEDMYWVQGNNNLVIQAVADFNKDRVIPLGVKIKENKEFTIRIDTVENADKNLKIYLNDKLKDSIHDLRKSAYVSKSEPGFINERFEIVFHKEEPIPTVVEVPAEINEDDEIYKEFGISIRHGLRDRELQVLNPHELSITNMFLFDFNGNKLEDHDGLPGGKEFRMPVRNYSSGVYIVQLVVEGRVVSKKIIINN